MSPSEKQGGVLPRRCELNQEKIWRHFQGEGSPSFASSHPRLRYLVAKARGWGKAKGRRLLNIGVGDGYLESQAASQGFDVYSLDPDAEAIARVRQNGVKGFVGHIEAMPFQTDTFDVVIASEVLEHLDAQQRSTGLHEITRVLKRSGKFLGTTPYDEDLTLGNTVCPCCGKLFHRWGHQASFTLASMRQALEANLVVTRLTRTAFPSFANFRGLWIKPLVRVALAKLGQQIASPNIYFAAAKR